MSTELILPGQSDGTEWRNRIVGEGTEAPEQLMVNPQNWRTHPQFQQDVLSSVLDEVGWIQEVIVNRTTGHLIDGHLRVTLAMRHEEKEIPVKYVELSPEEEALVLTTLDPIAGLAVADDEKLKELMAGIQSEDGAIAALMNSIKEDAGILDEEPDDETSDAQIDKAEELQEKWQVSPGDIWRMGQHFVICADCREPETWTRLLKAAGIEKVNGVFTSPPYAEQRKKQYGGTPTDQYVEWWDAVQSNARASLTDDGSFFVNIKPHCEKGQRALYVFDLVLAMVRRWGWRFVDELSWTHQGYPGDYKKRFKNQFEPVYHFSIGDQKFRFENVPQELGESHKKKVQQKKAGTGHKYLMEKGAKAPSGMSNFYYYGDLLFARAGNVVNVNLGDISAGKGAAAFPVKLPAFFIKAYSDTGDTWCDPFLGSGTTIIAAHKNDRRGIGIERLEKYVAVTLERFYQMTNIEPALLSDG